MNIIAFIRMSGFYLRAHLGQEAGVNRLAAVLRDGQIIDMSENARQFGVTEGLDKKTACRRCPQLQLAEFDSSKAIPVYDSIWSRLAQLTPQVEPLDYHLGYLDLTGCVGESETPDSIMTSIRSEFTFSYRIRLQWGGGRDAWIARVAGRSNSFIHPEAENTFLSSTSVEQLDLEHTIVKRLQRYKIRTIQDLMQVPRSFLSIQLELEDADLFTLLHRGSRSITAVYPPPELEFTEDLPWGLEEEVRWACLKLSIQASESLKSANCRAHELLIEFRYERGNYSVVKKFDKAVQESERIYTAIIEQYRSRSSFTTLSIHIKLRKLVPVFKAQLNLLDRQETDSSENAIGKLRTSLHARYGPRSLMRGLEYSQQVPQRFAQLLCKEKGWTLP